MTIFPEDPRTYLRSEYEQRHKRNPSYSWRSFARDLKLSPSMLSEFLKGRYGFSKGKASSIAQAIRLDVLNTEHFIDLLEAGFHRLPTQRENARLRVEERARRASTTIPTDHLRGLMDWTLLAMLEIAGLEGGEPLTERWTEPFRAFHGKAKAGLAKLRALRLIGEDGQPSEAVTVAGDQLGEEELNGLHAQTLELAARALSGLSSRERENLSIFGSIRAEDFADMRKEMNDTILQILNKYASRPGTDSVFTFALQAFPLYIKPR